MVFHLTTPTVGRLVLARSTHELRWCVATVSRLGGDALAFSVVDEHIHLVTRTGDVGRQMQRLRVGLSRRLGLGPTHVRPVESRQHLLNVVPYALLQPRKHGLRCHPAVYEGSMAGELLGWRLNPHFDSEHLETELPRWRTESLWPVLGFDRPPARVSRAALQCLGPEYLRRRAEECLFAVPYAAGKVRALVGQICGGDRRVARALGLSRRGLHRARERDVPEAHVRALALRVAIDHAVLRGAGLPE
mgnify:CR=1 FL=1